MNSNYSEALKRCTDSPEQMNAHEGTKEKEKKEHKGERERENKKKGNKNRRRTEKRRLKEVEWQIEGTERQRPTGRAKKTVRKRQSERYNDTETNTETDTLIEREGDEVTTQRRFRRQIHRNREIQTEI